MPRFAANLNFLFTELSLLDRFEAAAKAGFKAVESTDLYAAPAAEIAARLKSNGLTLALFNAPTGDASKGERGLAALPERQAEFAKSFETALRYAEATGGRRVHLRPGPVHPRAPPDVYLAHPPTAARQ